MKCSITGCLAAGVLLVASGVNASADASKKPQFHPLPPLREQDKLVNAWTEERKTLIPGILRKYGVDAWLVCTTRHYKDKTVLLTQVADKPERVR